MSFFFSEHEGNNAEGRLTSCVLIPTKSGKESVGEGETGKKAKATPYAGGKS
jgi:hypothetical protein